jgi:hypothetical protein
LPEIGKNNPKAELIKTDNEIRMKWNREVDRALVSDVPEEEIRQIKQEYITDKVKMSVTKKILIIFLYQRLKKCCIMNKILPRFNIIDKYRKRVGIMERPI